MSVQKSIAEMKQEEFTEKRIAHWDGVAKHKRLPLGRHYQRQLKDIYRFIIPSGSKVLELGCARGSLLAALNPSVGVGVDFSQAMIEKARAMHPQLRFETADAHDVELDETFDYIIMSDLLNDVWDAQALFANVSSLMSPSTRLVINTYSKLWQPMFSCAQSLGLANKTLQQNWFTVEDTENLLHLEGMEIVKHFTDILIPMKIPVLEPFANRYLSKTLPFRWFALNNFLITRKPESPWKERQPTVSVVVPARNEEGTVEEIFTRTPQMGAGTEIVFVENNSSDNTYETIKQNMEKYPEVNAQLWHRDAKGKVEAMRLGYSKAKGDIFMILDADLTVPPEDLPRFYDAIVSGKGECINGVRLVYPMEEQAMRFINLMGNKFFSLAFTWMLGQPIKDTLCGTKVVSRETYEEIAANRSWFGDFDPFGDFDLLFGAAKLNKKILDLPIRYRERTYGETNINRWREGALLLRMVTFAARRIKFF